MAAPIEFHPCVFNFDDVDIKRVGSVTSGGKSLSGIDDTIQSDGGGYWTADFSTGDTLDRDEGLAWRALTEAMDNGSAAVNVRFCERLFQPVYDAITLEHDSDTLTPGAVATAAAAALRATALTIAIASERPLRGGEVFSIQHATWGHRAYRVVTVVGAAITIRPPLREAIADGTVLDFDTPRCQMRLAQPTSNATNIGQFTSCAISFVEDMRPPAS